MKYLRKWLQLIKERFNPVSYTVMIFVFLGAHYVLYLNFIRWDINLIPLVLAVFLFFSRLRLFDEIKDIDSDTVHHPERPLPRGLLAKNDVLHIAFILVVLEIALFSFYGFLAFLSAVIAVSYSLVMYREFFIKKWLRAHLATYAVLHTFVVVFISLAIFFALFGKVFTKIPGNLLYFSLAGWFLFNIFEFGRKTFAGSEEKDGVDSYSKIFGKFGAVMLVLVMAVLSMVFISKATVPATINILSLWLVLIGFIGLLYVASNRLYFAKIYRAITSLYIILTYGTILICGFFTPL